jgi:anti-sigma B factor antagonist
MTTQDDVLTMTAVSEQARTVIHLRGEIDGETCSLLELIDQDADRSNDLVLDLSSVSFIDSAGLRTLITIDQDRRRTDTRVVLRHPSAAVTRLLELTGLLDVFDVEATLHTNAGDQHDEPRGW